MLFRFSRRPGLQCSLTDFLAICGNLVLDAVPVAGQDVSPVRSQIGVVANLFDLSQVQLSDSRWMGNQERTLAYLTSVDVDRMLYNFRMNHNLSTEGAEVNGGWDAPDFPFRSHVQGHMLTAWAQCWATTQDTTCRDRATSFVSELAKCQANDANAGFSTGYLAGFPESDFTALENGTLTNSNVPWYVIHKIMAGLLDVWVHVGDTTAKDVLLSMAQWTDTRTSKLSYSQMQSVLETEYGGMNDILTGLYYYTGNETWLTTAQRFDHAAVFDPLAADEDQLDGLHANTQIPKWIGAAHEYTQTGNQTYLDIARNAWKITIDHHSYAIGGNSEAEHFHEPDDIAGYLDYDSAESCNGYNMLKLTRTLWSMDTNASYFDFYERTLLNQMLGQQDPGTDYGAFTYFTSLDAGGRRGVGPAWGGGNWSTEYESFWCCMGTGLETNTKLMDSIYAYDDDNLYVNLFTPSQLNWTQRGVVITQTSAYPVSDNSTLTVTGGTGDEWGLKIRIPAWTAAGAASIAVNGEVQGADDDVAAEPGAYATVTRAWADGDTVAVTLPMDLRLVPANDNQTLAAVLYGPTVLAGHYGNDTLGAAPTLDLGSIRRTGNNASLDFTATADGQSVDLGPFYDAQGFNYVVYWAVSGSLPA
ncbi:secreted protein [Xylariaceae sp. FL0804]|nr:secreted protein [Xylariaceae sp. FL0804]